MEKLASNIQCAVIVWYKVSYTVNTESLEDLESRCSILLQADLSTEKF